VIDPQRAERLKEQFRPTARVLAPIVGLVIAAIAGTLMFFAVRWVIG
jgi:hypothetical protein